MTMASTNMYLKLDGIDGESLDQDHQDWIEVESLSWGVSNPASFSIAQGGQATQADVSSFNIAKHMDKASVNLFKASNTGKHIASGNLECLKLDGDSRVVFFKVDFTDLVVTSVQWSGSGSDQALHEMVSFAFSEFKQSYKLQQDAGAAGGSTDFGFNIQTSKAT
ncbi:type VI secretion system tube protein Hcp [Bradyrhizobium sp. WSM1417]|uniref:Hcp family type VI secretion system effector n=1 Tax=Bradyrhizobium sp. WSM1417 TaxID=754500 RepID=UPI000488F642|nr:type VI secretion system tube protein Hcp [Bradyrhizobium sp. WSM1417]